MIKKYIVLILLLFLLGINISVQAMQGGGERKRRVSKRGGSGEEGGKKKRVAAQCTICIDGGDLQALPCGHTFHAECLGRLIQSAFGSRDTNFDQLRCPNFSSDGLGCAGVLTREEIGDFTSLSSSSSSSSSSSAADGNATILAFYDERVAERANPTVIVVTEEDAVVLAELIAAGQLQICPGCRIPTERTEGCNHMTCSTNKGGCGTHYCYPCGTRYNGIGWGARACACPHFPDPIPLAGGLGGALPQANPRALINAAEQGNPAVVNVLLRAGAGVNIQDASGNTALHNAAREGHLPVVNALLATPGILVNRQNARDWTAFDVAAHYGHLPVFQALLAAGADVSTPDTDGNTALHRAAREGRLRVVNALIAAGADIIIQDANGQTALQLATRNGHLAVVAALR